MLRIRMKEFLNLFCVFTSILIVDSTVKVMDTIPQIQKNTFPALIMQGPFKLMYPAVPRERVNNDEMFTFEKFDLAISYLCPRENSLEVEASKEVQCTNKLTVLNRPSGDACGNDNRIEYNIGYGFIIRRPLFNPRKKDEKVEYPLYSSCYDKLDKRIYHVEYELRHRNKLYEISSKIYPEQQLEEITKHHLEFRKVMANKFDEQQRARTGKPPKIIVSQQLSKFENKGEKTDGEGYLIPFQLVSHEDMILYNWKLATFNEMNYSLIWSNIADNAWKKLNDFLRTTMIKSNYNLHTYSGVHDYTEQGYPRYLWKFLRVNFKGGIVVVIHNHAPGDTDTYDPLCAEHSCEEYVLPYMNQKNKNLGYTYCCLTKELKKKIPFFNQHFLEIDPLMISDLFTVNDDIDVSPPPSPPVIVPAPVKTTPVPTAPAPNFRREAAPYDPKKRSRRRPIQLESIEATQESEKHSVKHEEDDDATKELKRKIEQFKSGREPSGKQSVDVSVNNAEVKALRNKIEDFVG
ncbi:uncharacterized protein LOC135843725 [Planococcus citri]|uniref:uncharacterized protein LOC135843725 n=1 Tax=Planococcus citri TaxID=170843 RepID=UPI0031F97D41